jgi:hypothetical protein
MVAATQPVKLAAMEGHFQTEARAPLRIGGWPDEQARHTRWAIEIPGALSWLAYGDADAVVRGLDEFPRKDTPPVLIVHLAFQASEKEWSLMHRAISPVWETNHVWLIFVLVLLQTAFPPAFAALSRTLWLPSLRAGASPSIRLWSCRRSRWKRPKRRMPSCGSWSAVSGSAHWSSFLRWVGSS